jgi:hypothetical protein
VRSLVCICAWARLSASYWQCVCVLILLLDDASPCDMLVNMTRAAVAWVVQQATYHTPINDDDRQTYRWAGPHRWGWPSSLTPTVERRKSALRRVAGKGDEGALPDRPREQSTANMADEIFMHAYRGKIDAIEAFLANGGNINARNERVRGRKELR